MLPKAFLLGLTALTLTLVGAAPSLQASMSCSVNFDTSTDLHGETFSRIETSSCSTYMYICAADFNFPPWFVNRVDDSDEYMIFSVGASSATSIDTKDIPLLDIHINNFPKSRIITSNEEPAILLTIEPENKDKDAFVIGVPSKGGGTVRNFSVSPVWVKPVSNDGELSRPAK
ncbi:hypothetical protein B0H17DRAFT_1210430 [Mycena rosella]|uniref:Uncharacterized protein n=1 Tax=Mycena rosella TaxID=1033263 RepID=A0AAD7G8G1_MYCRO|nr:hypothetical protein B0H17DRAFT_1210430 [Mycena rosella]